MTGQEIVLSIMVIISAFVFFLVILLRRKHTTLQNWIKGLPLHPISADHRKISQLDAALRELNLEEKLIMYQSLFGKSFHALINVSGNNICIIRIGKTLELDDEENEMVG